MKEIDYSTACFADLTQGFPYADPDAKCEELREMHYRLYNRYALYINRPFSFEKKYPLSFSEGRYFYLSENGSCRLGSDTMNSSYLYYEALKNIKSEMEKCGRNAEAEIEKYRKDIIYRPGNFIVFPKKDSINVERGRNGKIKDRFDLTLDCIKKQYEKEDNPLAYVLQKNWEYFFCRFRDFNEYVHFFMLEDYLDEKCNVMQFIDNEDHILPKNLGEYDEYIKRISSVIEKRTKRILKRLKENAD